MDKIKTVLLSTFPLPYSGIASWTTMMNYLLKDKSEVDYVISPNSTIIINTVKQIFVRKINILDKLKNKKDNRSRFNRYIEKLALVLEKEDKIILQIIDDIGLLKAVLFFIKNKKMRNRILIQYHYHSFHLFTTDENILNSIDDLILLTESSYLIHKKYSLVSPFHVEINWNGIDTSFFKKINQLDKNKFRENNNLSKEKLIFIWCSQDRKKKGLDLILSVWNKVYSKNKGKVELLVVGTRKLKIDIEGVRFIGKIQNSSLAPYYQMSDFYLFPSLCLEGFGMSLIEALMSNCYCIASDIGGISEVLGNGKYGKLVKNPHQVDFWVKSIEDSIQEYTRNNNKNPYFDNIPDGLYEIEEWKKRYNKIILNSKERFDYRFYLNEN